MGSSATSTCRSTLRQAQGDRRRAGPHRVATEGLAILRHSTAHVLAQAVQAAHADAKLGIGPPISDGFYYDFDVAEPFTPEDLKNLEKAMQRIVKERQRFRRRVVTDEEARTELAAEPYKLELIADKGSIELDPRQVQRTSGPSTGSGNDAQSLTIYDNLRRDDSVAWKDLCRGPHVPHTGYIPAFALTSVSAAYWRGDQANPQLQRIYGTAWPSREELKAYQFRQAEAAKRDHRKLGRELDLFSFPDELGSGLAVFHPKGGVLRKVMEDYSRQRHVEGGYEFVYTPHITKADLFVTSGHLDFYADGMFPPMHLDEERHPDGQLKRQGQDYYLKPMNCPMHCLIFRSRGRSYRELPLRLFEFGGVYRYEMSGVIHGLTRVRGMTQDDAHIYCTPEQMQDELISLLDFVLELLARLRAGRLLPRALHPRPGEVDRHRRGVGAGHRGAAPGRGRLRTGAGARSGRRRVLRPEDPRAGPGRHRSDLAAVDHPGRPDAAGTLRPGDHGVRRQPAAADHDPPGPVRLGRTLHRRPHRALRRRFPAVAGAGPGDRYPGGRRVQRLPRRGRVPAQPPPAYGSRSTPATSGCRRRSGTPPGQGSVHAHRRGDDAAAGAVSFRYRDGQQKNGVPVDEAIAEITDAIARRVQV